MLEISKNKFLFSFSLIILTLIAGTVFTPQSYLGIENVSALESVPENSFEGTVSKVIDGDTLNVKIANGETIPVRLTLVDAPETNEQGYSAARDFVSENCLGKQAIVDPDNRQQLSFGRLVALVYCGDVNINEAVIANGFATLYASFCSISEFANTDWAQRYGCNDDGSTSSSSSSSNNNNNNNDDNDIQVDINIGQNPIQRGKEQKITVKVSDSDSGTPISGANVDGKVRYASESTNNGGTFEKVTGTDGQVSHSWQISGGASLGTFTVLVDASADGHGSTSETKSFQVISLADATRLNGTQEQTLPISNETSNNTTISFGNSDSNSGDADESNNGTDRDELTPICLPNQTIENGVCIDPVISDLFLEEIQDPIVCAADDPNCGEQSLQQQEEFLAEPTGEDQFFEGEIADETQEEENLENTKQSDDDSDEQDTEESTGDESEEESNNEEGSEEESSEEESSDEESDEE